MQNDCWGSWSVKYKKSFVFKFSWDSVFFLFCVCLAPRSQNNVVKSYKKLPVVSTLYPKMHSAISETRKIIMAQNDCWREDCVTVCRKWLLRWWTVETNWVDLGWSSQDTGSCLWWSSGCLVCNPVGGVYFTKYSHNFSFCCFFSYSQTNLFDFNGIFGRERFGVYREISVWI